MWIYFVNFGWNFAEKNGENVVSNLTFGSPIDNVYKVLKYRWTNFCDPVHLLTKDLGGVVPGGGSNK